MPQGTDQVHELMTAPGRRAAAGSKRLSLPFKHGFALDIPCLRETLATR